LLTLLERLLDIEGINLDDALRQAAQLTVEAFGTDKVDIFLFDARTNSLVARGASDTPLGRKQRAIGMDVQPVVNGGRAVDVFRTGDCYLTGHADQDLGELTGVTQGLGVHSETIVPLVVAGERRGVLAVQAEATDTFSERDQRVLQAVSRWIGGVVHRAELLERTAAAALEEGRRAAADELVMVVAHDLRNHLTPIRGRIGLIRRRSARIQDSEISDHVDAIQESLGRLESMIADMLDVARLEHGLFALVPRSTDLVALVQESAARFRSEMDALPVRAPQQLIANVDSDRIRQALENLLANALKHAPQGVSVELTVSAETGGEQPTARIGVADRGGGIAPELLGRLFERFASSNRASGLGLGLYLAHRIALAHGGSIGVDSVVGQGSTFTLVVPLNSNASDIE
jgi:signal transduction histidine kinase